MANVTVPVGVPTESVSLYLILQQLINNGSGSSGGAPTGSAGGDLGGTYPNPTVVTLAHVASASLTSAQLKTILSDGTGTGVNVFNVSPAFTGTPTFNGTTLGALATVSAPGSVATAAAVATNATGGFITNGGTDGFGTIVSGVFASGWSVAPASVSSGNGTAVVITGGAESGTGPSTSGGSVNLVGGAQTNGSATAPGGAINLNGGSTLGSGAGGAVNINGGSTSGSGAGGAVNINGGNGIFTQGAINIGTSNGVPINIGSTGYPVTLTGVITVAGNMAFTGAGKGIVGGTTSTLPSAGNVGYTVTNTVASGSPVSLTTATTANICDSGLLAAGHYLVSFQANVTSTTATMVLTSPMQAGISTTSATLPSSDSIGSFPLALTVGSALNSIPVASQAVTLTSSGHIYGVMNVTFSAGSEAGFGKLTVIQLP